MAFDVSTEIDFKKKAVFGHHTMIVPVTASRDLTIEDAGKLLLCTNTSSITLTAVAGLPPGFQCSIVRGGTGAVVLAAGSGATIPSSSMSLGSRTDLVVTANSDGNAASFSVGAGASSGAGTLAFGAFPGATDATLVITGQAGIAAGSIVDAWIVATATADHSIDEHQASPPRVTAGNISAGVGFTIYGVTPDNTLTYGDWSVMWRWS